MDLGLAGRTVAIWGLADPLGRACRDRFEREGALVVDGQEGVRTADVVVLAPPAAGDLDLDRGTEALDAAWEGVVAAVTLYQEALDHMTSRCWGRMVYVVGDDELDTVAGMGVLGLHKCVAWECGPDAVTANAVARGRGADDAEVAAAVAFLASERAGYLSGITMTVGLDVAADVTGTGLASRPMATDFPAGLA